MGTFTPNFHLYKPAVGETGWGTAVDTNFDTLDVNLGYLSLFVSVKQYGAVGDGIADDTAAFTAAAAGVGVSTHNGPFASNGIATAPRGRILVPSGTYLIASLIETLGRHITWVLEQGAVVVNYANLNGRIERPGERVNDFHHGIMDYACGYSISSNSDLEEPAAVLTFTDPSQLGTFATRDSVSFFADNSAPAILADVTTANYTASTMVPGTPLTATQVKKLRIGMMIDTKHGTKYTGFITGWAADGSSITVGAWYLSPGPGTPATPANGVGASVNPILKIWAFNGNVILTPASFADSAAGFELGVVSSKANFDISTPTLNRTWGFDCVNLGTKRAEIAFYQREDFYHGFSSKGAFQSAFHVEYNVTSQHPQYGLMIEDTPAVSAILYAPNGVQKFAVDNIGIVEIGAVGATNTPAVDFHCHATGKDYDFRMLVSGGSANVGEANVTMTAGVYLFNTSAAGVVGEGFRVATTGGATVNYIQALGSITTSGPTLGAEGTDTNIHLNLSAKGTGRISTDKAVQVMSTTGIPAGGTAGSGINISSATNFGVFFGSGAPTLSAAKGSLYLRSDGSGINDRMYVNTNGSTTWTAVVTVA